MDLKGVAHYNCYITTMECQAITHSDLIRLHKIHHQKLDFGPRPHLSKKVVKIFFCESNNFKEIISLQNQNQIIFESQ